MELEKTEAEKSVLKICAKIRHLRIKALERIVKVRINVRGYLWRPTDYSNRAW